ncbi:hypothetical protein BH10PLA1_BH10PLA1_22440 [soil metagenome]
MPLTREQICAETSKKLHAVVGTLPSIKATIGLDGFVDEIINVVDKRTSTSKYTTIDTIGTFGGKIVAAAGQSSNYELIVKLSKLGGNGPIMANALASFGIAVTYIGSLGYPTPHPVFEEFAKRAKVISISEPGHTDAIEFSDGKLMLGKIECLEDVNWDTIVKRVGLDAFIKLLDGSSLIGMVNWTMLQHMNDIWNKILTDVLPKTAKKDRTFFIDLADPEKRTHADILSALQIMEKLQGKVNVILGLNLKESGEIVDVLGLPAAANAEAAIESTAAAIREKLNLQCVVIHPRKGAAAATKDGTAKFLGPFVQNPKISTGAGDHFNAGFCLGRTLGFDLEQSLCCGVATSGYYVRSANSPSGKELADFIAELPPPQAE